ncbi:MAG: hypothetical protein J6Q22_10635 [Prevotella sp.]|nr:hypothetical protein [Prevotella sp.]
MEIDKPSAKDCQQVMKEICSVKNPWAFCLSWQMENPKLFNKFMEMCAYFRKDEQFISHKVKATEFLYHKKLKRDVLVVSTSPDEEGRICFWHTDTRMWVHDKSDLFSAPKKTF